MDATISDLVATIGEQTVELRLLRQALNDLQVASNLKDQEISKFREDGEEKTKNNKKEK